MRKELCRGIYQNIHKQNELKRNGKGARIDKFKEGWETDCNCYFCENVLAQQGFKVHFSYSLKRFKIP